MDEIQKKISETTTQLDSLRLELQQHEFNINRIEKRAEEVELAMTEFAGNLRGLRECLELIKKDKDGSATEPKT